MIWRCWAVIPPWLAALLLLVPLPTRDNMQAKPTRPWDVLARQVTGTVSGGGVYVRIAWLAYIEVCFARGSIRSRPLSVRRERGPDFLPIPSPSPKVGAVIPARNCDFRLSRVRIFNNIRTDRISNCESRHVFTFGRRVSASAAPVAGRRAVYLCD